MNEIINYVAGLLYIDNSWIRFEFLLYFELVLIATVKGIKVEWFEYKQQDRIEIENFLLDYEEDMEATESEFS